MIHTLCRVSNNRLSSPFPWLWGSTTSFWRTSEPRRSPITDNQCKRTSLSQVGSLSLFDLSRTTQYYKTHWVVMFRRYMYKVTPILPKRPSCSGRRENKFRERILIVFPVVCLPCKSKLEILLFVSSRPQLGASNGGPRPLHLTVVVPLRKPSQRRPAHSHARKSGLAKTSIFLSLLFLKIPSSMRRLFSFVPPITRVSGTWRTFWAHMAPFKGPQPCLVHYFQNLRDNKIQSGVLS